MVSEPLEIKMDLIGSGGQSVADLFARVSDPEPPLRDFGEYKRRRIVMLMPKMPRAQRNVPGAPPAKRTTLFSQRITCNVSGDKLEEGTFDERGRILQEGGTIHAKAGGALTVPIHEDAIGKRARDFDNLTLIPRKAAGKPPLLVRMRGRSTYSTAGGEKRLKKFVAKAFDLMFVLLKSVTIKPHPYLWWDDADADYLLLALKRQVESQ